MEKPFLTFEEQLNLLEKRGLKILNREEALIKISNINYYKLKEFAEIFRKKGNEIEYENGNFEDVLKRFYTDKSLRIYLLDAIEKVEISLKTKIGYILGKHHGEIGYQNFNNWCNKEKYCRFYINDQQKSFKNRISEYVGKRTTPSIIEFLRNNSQNAIPVWMIMEVLTFGDIVKLYELMSNKLRREIAEFYDLEALTLEKYLKNLNLIRNLSAHNTKIINLKLQTLPPIRADWRGILKNRQDGIATTLVILEMIIKKINLNYHFANIYKILNEYIDSSNLKAEELGFKEYNSINYFKK